MVWLRSCAQVEGGNVSGQRLTTALGKWRNNADNGFVRGWLSPEPEKVLQFCIKYWILNTKLHLWMCVLSYSWLHSSNQRSGHEALKNSPTPWRGTLWESFSWLIIWHKQLVCFFNSWINKKVPVVKRRLMSSPTTVTHFQYLKVLISGYASVEWREYRPEKLKA